MAFSSFLSILPILRLSQNFHPKLRKNFFSAFLRSYLVEFFFCVGRWKCDSKCWKMSVILKHFYIFYYNWMSRKWNLFPTRLTSPSAVSIRVCQHRKFFVRMRILRYPFFEYASTVLAFVIKLRKYFSRISNYVSGFADDAIRFAKLIVVLSSILECVSLSIGNCR